jgi:hypothetical protein
MGPGSAGQRYTLHRVRDTCHHRRSSRSWERQTEASDPLNYLEIEEFGRDFRF